MLWISYDRKNFKQALIPSNVGHENYRVASIKSVQALVIVEHSDGVFNLYTSDETGQYFSLSLNDITITKNGNSWFIDLEIVRCIILLKYWYSIFNFRWIAQTLQCL